MNIVTSLSKSLSKIFDLYPRHGYLTIPKFLLVVLVVFVGIRVMPDSGPAIEMHVYAEQPGTAQLFFDSGSGYSEDESVSAKLKPGNNQIRFVVPPGSYRNLRFDPIDNDSAVTIRAVSIEPSTQVRGGSFGIADFVASSNVAAFTRTTAGIKITPITGSSDPQLAVHLEKPFVTQGESRSLIAEIEAALVLTAFIWFLYGVVLPRLTIKQIVIVSMSAAFILMIVMSSLSPADLSIHPDEALHLSCFDYYLDHFWPPAADSPNIRSSLTSSVWGVSYLNAYDVVYFFAAHITSPFSAILGSPLSAARAFQHLLWAILLILAIRGKNWAIGFSVLLISPQIWYIFSYFNSDAFPFFLAMVAVMLACDDEAGVKLFLDQKQHVPNFATIVFSLCVGLLLVSKLNYLPIIFGLFLWLAIRQLRARWTELAGAVVMASCLGTTMFVDEWGSGQTLLHGMQLMMLLGLSAGIISIASLTFRYWRDHSVRPAFHRMLVLLGMVLLFAAPRIIDDLWLNGTPATKTATVTAAAEKYAQQDFKPSLVAAGGGNYSLRLDQKGVSLSEMLIGRMHWFSTSWSSAFGTYSYMDIWAPKALYHWMWICVLLLIGMASVMLVRVRRMQGAKQVFVVLSTCTLVLLSSILFSWLYAFQPQGRYLLPMVPMIALILNAAAPYLAGRLLKLILVVLFGLSVYSYACVGLPGVVALI